MAVAQTPALRIGAHVILDEKWSKNASRENRNFVAALKAQTKSGRIETLPSDRLYQLYQSGQLDCILTGGWPHDDPQLISKRVLTFEVRLLTLANTDLPARSQILVGRMKQFPPPALPLETTLVDWLPLQNLKQGFDLLRARRIDALLADPSHIQNAPQQTHEDIIAADLPAVKRFSVPLLCHDTDYNRDMIDMLDQETLTQ
ncbi:hypothetical protein HED22_16830 [Thalassospira sp. HF15]|uniref:hypothetical protein n=1 Tax=Thalassospira sp. HF15 TaxID=2722755 RepID=UPI001431983B|nr:hypothetical protein [Thalassospira sp. HF15]NIY77320.1 hypothetical protein [Thalassospira sp. HF15]